LVGVNFAGVSLGSPVVCAAASRTDAGAKSTQANSSSNLRRVILFLFGRRGCSDYYDGGYF